MEDGSENEDKSQEETPVVREVEIPVKQKRSQEERPTNRGTGSGRERKKRPGKWAGMAKRGSSKVGGTAQGKIGNSVAKRKTEGFNGNKAMDNEVRW